jgi:hypothetical protein
MAHIIFWLEVNIVNNRKTRLRADRIIELRDDWVSEGKGKPKKPIVRIILEGGTNVVAEGETMQDLWDRLKVALQQPFQNCPAPERSFVEPEEDDV